MELHLFIFSSDHSVILIDIKLVFLRKKKGEKKKATMAVNFICKVMSEESALLSMTISCKTFMNLQCSTSLKYLDLEASYPFTKKVRGIHTS